MRRALSLCTLVVLVATAGTGIAAIPQTMSYQGVLKDAAGVPLVNQAVVLVFTIYDDPGTGSMVWDGEVHSVTTDASGIVSLVLGSVNPIDTEFDQPCWLEVELDGAILTPRVELTSSPYAFRAASIDADVVSSIDGVTNDEGNIDLVAGSNVTITPDDVANTITISAAAGGAGDITAVYADDGLTGTATSGDAHVSVGAGDGIHLSSDAVAVNAAEIAGEGLVEDGSNNLAVNAGTGLQVSGDAVGLTSAYSSGSAFDGRFVNEGQANSVTTAMVVPNVVSGVDGVTNDGGNIDLVAGSNVTITPNDAANTITFSAAGGGGIGGSGTTNYIPKLTASTTIGNSIMYESGGTIFINQGSRDARAQEMDADLEKDGGEFTRSRNPAQLSIDGIDTWTIYGEVSDADGFPGEAAIYGYRSGSHAGVGYGVYSTNNAVAGYSYYGDAYTFGVAGYTYGDYSNCGGVFGSEVNGNYWGSLGYKDASSRWWGVYTPNDLYVGGRVGIGTASASGDLVTIESSGTGFDFSLQAHNSAGTSGAFFSRHDTGSSPVGEAAVFGVGGPGAIGGYFVSDGDDDGVRTWSNGAGDAIYAWGGPGGYAGYFVGDVHITGILTGGKSGSKMDHPLDPENKYLCHSAVESPDMMNIYNGNVVLDDAGAAWVRLPEWFEAVNGDYRYQLTAVGAPGPNLHIAEEIVGNEFRIAGGEPDMRVSWQVTGIRHDPFAESHRTPVEEEKPADEVGTYMHPEAYGLPETMSVDYERQASLRID